MQVRNVLSRKENCILQLFNLVGSHYIEFLEEFDEPFCKFFHIYGLYPVFEEFKYRL